MLLWDGSFTNKYTIISERSDGKFKILRIILPDPPYECMDVIVLTYNILSIIFDEFKHLFGIEKSGYHIIKYGSQKKLITLWNNVNRNDLADSSYINNSIQKLLVFRSIVGVSPNTVTNVFIRKTISNFHYPISVNDKYTISKDGYNSENKIPLSSNNLKLWFLDRGTTPDKIFREMISLKGDSDDRLIRTISEIKDKMEEITKTIDSDYVYVIHNIYVRMMNRIEA